MRTLTFLIITAISSINVFAQQTGSFTDTRDGNTYKTVKIGNQTWMAENLKYTNCSSCIQITDNNAWMNSNNNGWCYYNNDKNNASEYGVLYQWEIAENVCPTGWHLPSEQDWTSLINYLGGSEDAYPKLLSKNDWGVKTTTNSSGFNALPSGGRVIYNGRCDFINGYNDSRKNESWWKLSANFWTSSKSSKYDSPIYFYFSSSYDEVRSRDTGESFGYSVRCIKD